MNISDPYHSHIPPGVYVRSIIYIIAFYLNYLIIFDNCIEHKYGVGKFISINLIILVSAILTLYIVWDFSIADKSIPPHHGPHNGPNLAPLLPPPPPNANIIIDPIDISPNIRFLADSIRDGIILIFIIGLSVAIKLSQHIAKTKRQSQFLIASQREEELNSLKSQLSPHFLFNTLNSIYALIDICPQKAKQTTHDLSHMLRYILYETSSTVKLQTELNFIKNYIDLMKVRLGDKVQLNINIDEGNSNNSKIAPLIFISIVENVFKHGNTGNTSHHMDISITANDGIVTCHTFNYYNANSQSSKKGIGLNNLKRRLDLIYKENAKLDINKTDNTFMVDLSINLNSQPFLIH